MSRLYIPVLALALVGNSAFGQVAQQSGAMRVAKKASEFPVRAPQRPMASGAARDIIWSDDFSNPSNWVAGTIAGASNNTWVIGTTGPTGAFANQVGTITSTTASNGFALFDSDLLCSGNQHATLTIANPLDLSGYVGVLLEFEQNYKRFYDNVWVDWSTDGTNWSEIQVNADLDHGGLAAPTANPEFTRINVSGLAGSSTAYFRFRFESTPASVQPETGASYPGTLVGCAYAWMVDDVAITTLPDYEIQMNYAYTSTTGLGEEYGRIPSSQLPGTMNVGAEVFNLGLADQTNTVVNVAFTDVDGNAIPGFSGSLEVGTVVSGESVVADGDINIPANLPLGVYLANFTISSDNIAEDLDDSNNAMQRNFEVTDDIYSLDAIGNHTSGETLAQFGTASFTGDANPVYMTMYYISTEATYAGVTVELGSGTRLGNSAQIEAFMLDTLNIIQTPASVQPINGITSPLHTITQENLNNGAVGLVFEEPITLQPGAYYAAVRLYGSGTPGTDTPSSNDPEVYILDDTTVPQPGWTSAIFLPNDIQDDGTPGRRSYTNGNAFAIRLTSNPNVSVAEMKELTGINVFPNPTNGVFQISSDRTDVLFVEITDITGKVVRNTTLSSMATVDMSDVASGVYTVTVSSATERSVHKVTVK